MELRLKACCESKVLFWYVANPVPVLEFLRAICGCATMSLEMSNVLMKNKISSLLEITVFVVEFFY